MQKYMPGLSKKSFSLPFHGGEIWCEHLDSLYDERALLIDKFQQDLIAISKPSTSSFIAINLEETNVDRALIDFIADTLSSLNKRIQKVVFVGLNSEMKRYVNKLKINFLVTCLDDFEKAKEWLV